MPTYYYYYFVGIIAGFCFHRSFVSSFLCMSSEYVRHAFSPSSSSSSSFGVVNKMLLLQHRDTCNEIKRPRRRAHKTVNRGEASRRRRHVNRECGPERMNEVYSFHYIRIEQTNGAQTMRLRNIQCFLNTFFARSVLREINKSRTELDKNIFCLAMIILRDEQTIRSNMWTKT